jgi:hypothetical protein
VAVPTVGQVNWFIDKGFERYQRSLVTMYRAQAQLFVDHTVARSAGHRFAAAASKLHHLDPAAVFTNGFVASCYALSRRPPRSVKKS